ncbi:MAG TPA: hypothetical protein VGZ25_07200, partial [Gemmataceae bacterium]|nr:hypothetical protein [Gemmataceae bacterium]
MTKDPVFNAEDHREHDTHKLLTRQLRQDVIRVKEQMEQYATHLNNLCRNLERINDAVLRAQEFAECLLTDDLSGAWEVIRRSQQPNEWDPNVGHDWETDPLD